jgi:hypothetical protein
MTPRLALLASILVTTAPAAIGCHSPMRVKLYEGAPVGADVTLPPPAEFAPCREASAKHERLDHDGDGRVDAIRVIGAGGAEVCRGTDTNLDGHIDTWDVIDKGRVTSRAHDSDENGKVDQVWAYQDAARPGCAMFGHDHDGDGKADGARIDLCALLAAPVGVSPRAAALPLAPLAPVAPPPVAPR